MKVSYLGAREFIIFDERDGCEWLAKIAVRLPRAENEFFDGRVRTELRRFLEGALLALEELESRGGAERPEVDQQLHPRAADRYSHAPVQSSASV